MEDEKVIFAEEAGLRLTPTLEELLRYNLERVGCRNVAEMYITEEDNDDSHIVVNFDYKDIRCSADIHKILKIAIGDVIETSYYTGSDFLPFKVRLDLPPLNKVALTATRVEELVEALTCKENWIRELAEERYEEFNRRSNAN